jgi:hypothetical protein
MYGEKSGNPCQDGDKEATKKSGVDFRPFFAAFEK